MFCRITTPCLLCLLLLSRLSEALDPRVVYYPRFEANCSLTGKPETRSYVVPGTPFASGSSGSNTGNPITDAENDVNGLSGDILGGLLGGGTSVLPGPEPGTYCGPVGTACSQDNDCDQVPNTCPSGTKSAFLQCHQGFCRIAGVVLEGGNCDCLLGCKPYDPSGDFQCLNNVCTRDKCAECGQPPAGLHCCPPGILGRDGNCFCTSGRSGGCKDPTVGCANPNFDCCGDGVCRSTC